MTYKPRYEALPPDGYRRQGVTHHVVNQGQAREPMFLVICVRGHVFESFGLPTPVCYKCSRYWDDRRPARPVKDSVVLAAWSMGGVEAVVNLLNQGYNREDHTEQYCRACGQRVY